MTIYPSARSTVACLLVLAAIATIAIGDAAVRAEDADAPTAVTMRGAAGENWRFVGGAWQQNTAGVITPSVNQVDNDLAFYTPQAYQDFEARFEFRWNGHWTAAGFIFRAQDARHYYIVEFPATGQHTRAEHFWVTVSKVDKSGWREILHMQMVHGISSVPRIWHKAKVQVQGRKIRVWVDGRPVSVVEDKTYQAPGYIGLASYNCLGRKQKSSFRKLTISGQAIQAAAWNGSVRPLRNWGVVDDKNGSACTNIGRAGNGDLLTYSSRRLLRSSDNGQTWNADEQKAAIPDSNPYRFRSLPDGLLERYRNTDRLPFKILKSISQDDGRTWSEAREVAEVTFPPEIPFKLFCGSKLLETKAGTLLFFAWARSGFELEVLGGRAYQAAPLPWSQSYCLRSTDGGESWSDPVNIDGGPDPAVEIDGYEQYGKDEFNEVSAAQTRDGQILALIRPIHSPFMWETWSDDDGRSWTPAARGPFPLYACTNAIVSTSLGVLLVGGRFPGLTVQASYDNGMSWQGYVIDTCGWANGAMYEIEPDVVLFVYGGWEKPRQLRYQILRVTPEGLKSGKVVRFVSDVNLQSADSLPR